MNSVRNLTFAVIMIFLSLQSFGQASGKMKPKQKTKQNSTSLEPVIAKIRAEYARINAAGLKKEEFKFESEGCVEGGVVAYFSDKGNIVKVTESGSIGDGSWKTEYYFLAGKVIFCYDTITGGPAIGSVTKTTHRLYVNDDMSVKFMEGTGVVEPGIDAKKFIGTGYGLLKAYTTKDFAAVLCNP